jgi:chloride channel 7
MSSGNINYSKQTTGTSSTAAPVAPDASPRRSDASPRPGDSRKKSYTNGQSTSQQQQQQQREQRSVSPAPVPPPASVHLYEDYRNDDEGAIHGDEDYETSDDHFLSNGQDYFVRTFDQRNDDDLASLRRNGGESAKGGGAAGGRLHPFGTSSLRGDGYGGGGGGGGDGSDHSTGALLQSSGTAASLRRRRQNKIDATIESHNYEPDESEVWRAFVAQTHFANRGHWWTTGKKRALKRWILTFIIGVLQALVATLSNVACKWLSAKKFKHVYSLLNAHNAALTTAATQDDLYTVKDEYSSFSGNADDSTNNPSNGSAASASSHWFLGSAFLVFLAYQTLFAAIASLFVWIEPVSGGSGIPEIKCFLNGINLPRVVRIKTLLCKVVGVTFSVAAGLPVGKEGPMVHSGSVVAAGVSQGKARLWGVDTSFSKFGDFRNDREKRDFVACGAAAGVCSAFSAPIGGVLFSLEEGASYWSTKLTWRAFFCAMTTLATLFWIRNVDTLWGQASIDKLFSFGEFNSLKGEASNFAIWELLLFIVIGCLGGLIGAIFNATNEHLTLWRMRTVNFSKTRRFLEVIAVSMTVSIVSFAMPFLWGRCTQLPTDMQDWNNQEKNLVEALVPFHCVPGKEYNEVASLMFTEADIAIKQLFHFRENGSDDSSTFSSGALFLFFVPYISLAALTYGIAVPSGLFVPSLLSGAAFGRLFGHLLHKLDHTSGTFADSGTYALMGAAAVLGGMARMTISLTVILLEATGDMQYVLPLMLTLMAARFTGNVFNQGLYDIHINLKRIPFMEPDVPAIAERNEIVAAQVMSTEVKCLRPVERAGVVYDLLLGCSHGSFPIVDTASGGTLYGTAARSMLCTLLQRRAFGSPDVLEDYDGPQQNLGPRRLSPLVQWDTIERAYPRYPTIRDIQMRDSDRSCWLDLRPYANTAPYTVNETASIQRTYRLFRTLGLRTLCVVNHNNQVVGIITRKDLLPEALTDSLLRGRNAHSNEETELL